MGDCSGFNLPPGFHFCPTDEQLIVHFLYPKASISTSYSDMIIPHLLLLLDPRQLQDKALSGENQWYFFTPKIAGSQETENGFWKHLEIEEPIFRTDAGFKIGFKKYLVYYIGQPPTATETSWMMIEYHHSNSPPPDKSHKRNRKSSDSHEWVLCKVYQRKESSQNPSCPEEEEEDDDDGTELSCLDEMFLSLEDDLDDIDLSFLPN